MKRTLVERVDVSLLEEVARLMTRQYWHGRGEEITDEMEGEFWLSFARNAEEIIAIHALLPRLRADYDSLSTRHARAIEALGGCVEAIDHMAHGVRDKDAEGNILAAARAVLEEAPPTPDPRDALAQTAEAMTDAIQSRNLTEFKTVGEYFDRILAAPDDGVVERVRKGLEYGGEGGEAVTLREKLADMGLDADEQMKVLTFVEADARERERKAFVACAAAIMSTTWCLPNGKTTIEWAELEAARRYP